MKTKLILALFVITSALSFSQQNEGVKMQKADESGFIEVDKAPELKSQLKLEYPQLAKLAGIQGTVYLKLLIDEKGNVAKARIEKGVKDMLDEAALKAAKKAKFSPALLKNKPVKVWVVLPIAYKLDLEKERSLSKVDRELALKEKKSFSKEDGEPGPDEVIEAEVMPKVVEMAKPVYPVEAKKNNITGKVYVKVLIDKAGTPTKAIVIRSDSELFNQSAVDAALKSKFTPAINKGEKISVWVVIPFSYKLDNK